MDTLKPCPWCNRKIEMIKTVIPAYDHAKDCPLYGIAVPYKNWNKRTSEWVSVSEPPISPPKGDECNHEWVDATNAVVTGGEICLKCKSIREMSNG